jgi:hypothetical protein
MGSKIYAKMFETGESIGNVFYAENSDFLGILDANSRSIRFYNLEILEEYKMKIGVKLNDPFNLISAKSCEPDFLTVKNKDYELQHCICRHGHYNDSSACKPCHEDCRGFDGIMRNCSGPNPNQC